jgi:hypothetical protein
MSKSFIFRNGLENVKQMLERRATHTPLESDPKTAAFEKRQYEILLGQYVDFKTNYIY